MDNSFELQWFCNALMRLNFMLVNKIQIKSILLNGINKKLNSPILL